MNRGDVEAEASNKALMQIRTAIGIALLKDGRQPALSLQPGATLALSN